MVTASDFHPSPSGQSLTTGKLCYVFLSKRGLGEDCRQTSPRNPPLPLFLGQSRVVAVDKEEAAVSLTHENARRYAGWTVQKASTGGVDSGTWA